VRTTSCRGIRCRHGSVTVGSTTTDFAWSLAGNLPGLLQERVSGGGVTDYIYGPTINAVCGSIRRGTFGWRQTSGGPVRPQMILSLGAIH
jgi:hypothetical protein